ncbi:GNAT family N-acetyltransferase [Rhizobium sp. FKL33]|uniref:GNAT family N-acetyltransferase n=1 Tax=Rhizobium sp. FKL33 TaxID=2562307 RepID=UPI0010BF9FEC|nr:GNAT family N-acetyltransferase [Rhizobium sp. FKL33]
MTVSSSRLSFVTTRERPDLAVVTGRWRWNAFFSESGLSFEDLMERERAATADHALLPQVYVLLDAGEPIGMVALCDDDLDDRPDLNPWLAGLYVTPEHRAKGHARRLVAKIESVAAASGIERLSLYSASAVGLYRSLGWTTVETFARDDALFHVMRKCL